MDFIAARLLDGRWFRVLTVVDQFTGECSQLLADSSLGVPVRISAGTLLPVNYPLSRSGGGGQGRRQEASRASEPLTVRRLQATEPVP